MSTSPSTGPQLLAEPELRQITVVFCDLVGSTPLAQAVSAEDFHELIQDYQRTVRDVIRKYEGNVARTFGDGILVFFGHPLAHEDDAERAIRASCEAVAEMKRYNASHPGQPPVSIRIGIHTGPAVISRAEAGGGNEIQAIGDSVNLASRLQGFAEPDAVVISAATLKLVPGLFVTRDLGEPALKGIQTPVRVHQVLEATGARTRLEAAPSLTPFVGRERELTELESHWHDARNGRGRAVLLSAEPGIGKSRLLLALRERLGDSGHAWLECRCSPLAVNTAFAPWIELLTRTLGIADGDAPEARLEALERGVSQTGQNRAEAVPLLAPLLNVKLSAKYVPAQFALELKRKKTLEVIARWCLAQAARQPALLVVEDLHWADPSTIDLIGLLIGQVPDHALMLLPSARPEFRPAWPAQPHFATLPLEPLGGDATGAIIDSITGRRTLPAPVKERLLKQAGGVPLFLEEATKALLESGQLVEQDGRLELVGRLDRLAIPATLQDTLMARLDRLGAARQLIQLCAVIGREVPYALLSRIAEAEEPDLQQQLRALTDAQLLYVRGAASDATYQFKHALIQDAAYNSVWKKTRAKLHERTARAIEEHFPRRAKAEPELLATHFEAAGNIRSAIDYRKAASKIAARSSFQEAMGHAEYALQLLGALPAGQERLGLELDLNLTLGNLAAVVGLMGRSRAESAFARVRELCAEVQEPVLLGRALAGTWVLYYQRAEYAPAIEVLGQLMDLSTRLDNRRVQAYTWISLGYPRFSLGELRETVECMKRAAALTDEAALQASADQPFIYDPIVPREVCSAWAHWVLGHADTARKLAVGAVARADALRHPYMMTFSRVDGETTIELLCGNFAKVLTMSRNLQKMTEQFGATDLQSDASWLYAIACCATGRLDEGYDWYQGTIAMERSWNGLVWHSFVHGQVAGYLVRAGRLEEAKAALDAAFEMVDQRNERFWEADLHRVRAELARAAGAPEDEVESAFAKALEVARAQDAKALELRAATAYARFRHACGRAAEARGLLHPVRAWFTEGAGTADLAEADAVLAGLAG